MNPKPAKVMDNSPLACMVSSKVPPVKRGVLLNSTKAVASGVGDSTLDKCNIDETKRTSVNVYKLPQAWAEWLDNDNFHWNWYGHFTFRGYPHEEQAHKVWMKYTHKMNRHIYGSGYTKNKSKGVTWARSSEYQSRGSLHYHAIIGNNFMPDHMRFQYMKEWESMAGFARIHLYQKRLGAEYYLSKSAYAWKNGQIDISDNMKYHICQDVLQGR